ncbi:MAG: inositol monophosphatase family protein, partial [Alphaproteobacteria bacterium]|nr:inositol monophosphatase family protein [Alphaproteobacteria bacterium]
MTASHSPVNTAHFDQDILALLNRVGREDILPHFRNLDKKDVDTKASDTDFVTIADRQAEKHLIAGLKHVLPEARFVAEENTALHGLPEALESGYVWTIDPLDGTRNFVKGDEQFCSMLGLLYDGQPVAAWIYKPLSGEAVIAHLGQRPRYLAGNG